MRLKVRVRCAESAKPASCAAAVHEPPAIEHSIATFSRSHEGPSCGGFGLDEELRGRGVFHFELMVTFGSNEGAPELGPAAVLLATKQACAGEGQGDLMRVMVVPPGAAAAAPDPEASALPEVDPARGSHRRCRQRSGVLHTFGPRRVRCDVGTHRPSLAPSLHRQAGR